MKKATYLIFCLLLVAGTAAAQGQNSPATLDDIIAQAKLRSTSAKIAESIKENKYFQFLSYKAGLRPQLSLKGNLMDYSKDYFGVVQPDGNLIFQPRTQNYTSVGLSLSQQLGITGGTVAVNSSLSRFDDFDRDEKRYSGIPLNISLNQPLFAFNSYRWDKKIEPLKYQEAEKEYIREGENIALQTSVLYFNVLDAQAGLELSKKNIESQQAIFDIENKRINLGTTSKDKILQIELQLLTSTQELGRAEVNLKTSVFALKSYIGSASQDRLLLALPDVLPAVGVSVGDAVTAARNNRAEFIAYRRRRLEAERDLQLAKKERFQINLFTAYGYNNVGNGLSGIYQSPNSQQRATLGVQLPLLDWGRNRGKISVANSNLKTVNYTIEQEEIVLVQEITNLVENLRLIADNISIARRADLIANQRYELANDQFRFGKVSITELDIALSEKDAAKKSFINSLRTFWESYYQLRALTLMEL